MLRCRWNWITEWVGWLKKPNQIKSCEKSSRIIFHLELVVYFPLAVCFSFNQAQAEKQVVKKEGKQMSGFYRSNYKKERGVQQRGHRASVRWRAVFAPSSSGLRALDVKQVAGYWLALSPSEALSAWYAISDRNANEIRVWESDFSAV